MSHRKHITTIQREDHFNYYGGKVHGNRRTLMKVGRKNSPMSGHQPTAVADLGSDFNHDIIFVDKRGHVFAVAPKRHGKRAATKTTKKRKTRHAKKKKTRRA